MSEATNSIGYDWKSYDQNAGLYELFDDRCYFVTTADESVWRLVFTSYGGSDTGEIGMGLILEQASVISVNNFSGSPASYRVNIYPNPASGNGNLSIDVSFPGAYYVTMYNSLGAIVSQLHDENIVLKLNNLQPGLYVVEIHNSTTSVRKQLIIM